MDFTRVAAAEDGSAGRGRAVRTGAERRQRTVLLSLFAADGRVFRTPDDTDRLTGPLSDKMGTQDQRQAFFGAMLAKRPLARTS